MPMVSHQCAGMFSTFVRFAFSLPDERQGGAEIDILGVKVVSLGPNYSQVLHGRIFSVPKCRFTGPSLN